MIFSTMLSSGNKKDDSISNLMLQPLYLYLSVPAFLVSFTAPNRQSFRENSVFKSHDHVPNS